jgi:hypothetical protein
MLKNEISELIYKNHGIKCTSHELDLIMLAIKFEREHILRHIRNTAKGIDAKVATPDLWALAQYIEKTLL